MRQRARQAAACVGAGRRLSLSVGRVRVRAYWIATVEHVGLGRLPLTVGCPGVAILHADAVILPGAGWEGANWPLAVLGLGRTAAPVLACFCRAIISFLGGNKTLKVEQMGGFHKRALVQEKKKQPQNKNKTNLKTPQKQNTQPTKY